jgi:hypothetical protein
MLILKEISAVKIEKDGVFATIAYRDQGKRKQLVLGKNFVDLNDLDEYLKFAIRDHEIGDWPVVDMEKYAARLYWSAMTVKNQVSLPVTLTDFAMNVLSKEAEENGHSIQNEINKRLRATLYNDIEYRVRAIELKQAKVSFSKPKKCNLSVDRNMIDLLVASAAVDKHTFDDEVLSRLLVSFVNPSEMELMNHCDGLIRHHITNEEQDRQRIAEMAASIRIIEASQNKGTR